MSLFGGLRARGFGMAFALALLGALAFDASAKNGDEPLNHYGLITLSDKAVGARLASRFKAKGQPVFLVHDLNAGLGQNDIMRFSDKAVLVDGAVWSTLQAEGALEKLQTAPLVRVQARANSASWEQRANLVSGDRQKKAFKLGAELLRTLEENFGGTPMDDQLTVVFDEGHLTLLAPTELLDQLRFLPVRRINLPGKPRIVSLAPDTTGHFTGQPFDFQVWAIDPTDPSGKLTYQILGDLPPGVNWSDSAHALRGRPQAAGRWRLTAVVRNEGGLRDTLGFVLRVRANQPPYLSGVPDPIAAAGHSWRFEPRPSDPDHPGYSLKIRPGTLPPKMIFRADSSFLQWTPDSSLAGTRQAFSLVVEDPLGAKQEFKYNIQVVAKPGTPLSDGIPIELPWESLVQGRSYVWKTRAMTAAWAGQGILLQEIKGSDSTVYEGDSLRLLPMAAGMHELTFRFIVREREVVQTVSIPVREDLPPEFVTELTQWKLKDAGSGNMRYRPAAVDPEGEHVTLTASIPDGSPLEWDGTRLRFDPRNPGVYPALFTARDEGGNAMEQWVTFKAEPRTAGSAWVVENRVHGEFTAWSVTRDFGTGRIGVYTPDFTYGTIPYSYWMYKESPFLFIGGNLLGRRAESLGRTLTTDLGMSFRKPASRVYSAGLYLRLNGEWHFSDSPFSWIEMELATHVHQAMTATDSSMLLYLFKDTTDIRARDTLSHNGKLSKIIRQGFRGDNVRIFTRVEALSSLGAGFYAGPALWRDDEPMRLAYVQRLGGALRYRTTLDQDVYQFTMRVGWSPGGDGWGAYGTMRLSFGSPLKSD